MKIILGVGLVAALAVFFAQRSSAERQRVETVSANLSGAKEGLGQLESLPRLGLPDDAYADQRDQLASTIRQALDAVIAEADAPARKADALAARADLAWTLASLPTPAGATTRPALAPQQSRDESLDRAAADWDLVLTQFPDQIPAVAAARFGLAAVSEERGEFDRAAEQYEAVRSDERVVPLQRDLAADRLAALPELRTPLRLGTPGPRDLGPLAPGVLDAATTQPVE